MTPGNPPSSHSLILHFASFIPSPIAKAKPTIAHCFMTSAVEEFVSMTTVWDSTDLQKFPIQRNNKGEVFLDPAFNIVMAAGPAKLEFWSEIKGERRGEVMEVKYNEPLKHQSLGDGIADDGATPGGRAGRTKRASSAPPPLPGSVELE
jgi:hypothetical protein